MKPPLSVSKMQSQREVTSVPLNSTQDHPIGAPDTSIYASYVIISFMDVVTHFTIHGATVEC